MFPMLFWIMFFFFVIPYYSLMWRLILFNYFSHNFCPPRSPRPPTARLINKQKLFRPNFLSDFWSGFLVFLLFLDNSLRLFFFLFCRGSVQLIFFSMGLMILFLLAFNCCKENTLSRERKKIREFQKPLTKLNLFEEPKKIKKQRKLTQNFITDYLNI